MDAPRCKTSCARLFAKPSNCPSWIGGVGHQEKARRGGCSIKFQTERRITIRILNNHPVCGFAAATPPIQEGQSLGCFSRSSERDILGGLTSSYGVSKTPGHH